jgi:DNA modification methylase
VVAPRPTTIRRGDLFRLGDHRLLCGDATHAADVQQLLDGARPVLMETDPPYGVEYEPAWRHRRYPAQHTAVGRVAHDDRVDWTAAYQLFGGDVVYAWHAGLFAGPVATSLEASGFGLRAQIVWAKQHFALSRGDFHWQHEPCWYAVRRGASSHWQGDRTQATLWSVPNLNPMGGTRDGENAVTGHSTQKPVLLFERPILNHTVPGDAVYDPFLGSGTTLIAAEKTSRPALVMDIDPMYVQTAIDRWEAYSGKTATMVRARSRRT